MDIKGPKTKIFEQPSPVSIPVPWGYINGCSWGNPDGKPVLALHGWLDNVGAFFKLAPLLSKDLYIVAIDFPGHGQSSHRPPGCKYHVQDYLTDVKRVVDALGWKRFMFLSHSMGAGVSCWFAAALPDLVRGMVLIENIGIDTIPIEHIPKLTGKVLSTPDKPNDSKVYHTWDDAVKRLYEGHKGDPHMTLEGDPHMTLEAAEALCIRGTVRSKGGYQFSRDLRLKEEQLVFMSDSVNESYLRNISCPVLLIVTTDSFIDRSKINHRISCVPQDKIKLVQVAGGHNIHLYKPEVLAPLMDSFFQTIPCDFNKISKL